MSDEERTYFLQRAEKELELAQESAHPEAVAAHYRLAELYLERVYGEGDPVEGDAGATRT